MKAVIDQKGYTIVETLLAAGIGAMIVAVLGSAIFLFMRVTEEGTDEFRAQHDIQNTGHWLTRDVERAETTQVGGAAGDMTLTLTWTEDSQTHTVTYHRSDTDNTDLQRDLNDGSSTTEKLVARYVSSVDFSISNGLVTATIAYLPGGRWEVSKTATYKVWPRPTA